MAIFNSYVSLPEGNCFITNDGGWHPHSWLHPYVWHVSCHHMARRPRRVFLCHHQARVFRRVAQDGPGGEAHGCGPHSDRCSAQPAGLFVKLCPVFGEWDVDLTPRGYIWDIHIFWLWLMGATKLRPSIWIHYIYICIYIYIILYICICIVLYIMHMETKPWTFAARNFALAEQVRARGPFSWLWIPYPTKIGNHIYIT